MYIEPLSKCDNFIIDATSNEPSKNYYISIEVQFRPGEMGQYQNRVYNRIVVASGIDALRTMEKLIRKDIKKKVSDAKDFSFKLLDFRKL